MWADEVSGLDDGLEPDTIRPAKGVHVTIPWAKVRNDIAVVIPVPGDKRSLFVVPWGPARTADYATWGRPTPTTTATWTTRRAPASTPGVADDGAPRSLLVYARGLDYLKIAEHPDWRRPGPFGPVAADAEEIPLANGVARFSPAGEDFGNLVAIHAAGTDLYLESNLPRDELLAIAATLPVRGLPLEATTR